MKAIGEIPSYLRPFIAEQDLSKYSYIDHAAWRFIMRLSIEFFKTHAHPKYLNGLKETGISTDRIPSINEMDECLKEHGWRAVSVVGFIPPVVFMEFQSMGILPIACDIRTADHIAYTPAPDIVHEAAGHAPILTDPDYAKYLRAYGQVSRKAIFSKHDMEVYFAVRDLSDIKEDPRASQEQIKIAQERLDRATAETSHLSEAALLARMNWWTVEFGLIGDLETPKIYGAGLLSSVGESYEFLNKDVKKIPLTVDCVQVGYDITRPQPQLFVTPDFETLENVLEEFAQTMAFRRGGVESLKKAQLAEEITTSQLETGLQISGVLKKFVLDRHGDLAYLQYAGACQLSYKDQQLEGHGPQYHKEGFGTALGRVKGLAKPPQELSETELKGMGFHPEKRGKLEFESGVRVEGILSDKVVRNGKPLLLSFRDCRVTYDGQTFFDPAWGIYDMACGTSVPSVFGGAADRGAYLSATGEIPRKKADQKSNLTPADEDLNRFFEKIRKLRDSKAVTAPSLLALCKVASNEFPRDWLSRIELLELFGSLSDRSSVGPAIETLKQELAKISQVDETTRKLIERGIKALVTV